MKAPSGSLFGAVGSGGALASLELSLRPCRKDDLSVLAYFLGMSDCFIPPTASVPAYLKFPEGWEKADFQWPRNPRQMFRMDVGAQNSEQVAQLGIKQGDFVERRQEGFVSTPCPVAPLSYA